MRSGDDIWASLPVPAFLIDAENLICDVNSAGEGFLNASRKSVIGSPVWDQIAVDAPIEGAFARARSSSSPLFVNDIDVGSGSRAPLQCSLQIAPLLGRPGTGASRRHDPDDISARVGRAGQSQPFGESGGTIGDRHGRDVGP